MPTLENLQGLQKPQPTPLPSACWQRCPRASSDRSCLRLLKALRVGLGFWWPGVRLFGMASHLSSVLAKCSFEDVEFLAILQVRLHALSCCFAAPQKHFRSTLSEYFVWPVTKRLGRYLLLVAFPKPPRARSVTLNISRRSARSCRRLLNSTLGTITYSQSVGQVTHPFLNPSLATFQDSKFVYILTKFPVGGELFAHLAAAGFFNEEVLSFEMLRKSSRSHCLSLLVLCMPWYIIKLTSLFQVTRFYIGSMVRTPSFAASPSALCSPSAHALFAGSFFGMPALKGFCFPKY